MGFFREHMRTSIMLLGMLLTLIICEAYFKAQAVQVVRYTARTYTLPKVISCIADYPNENEDIIVKAEYCATDVKTSRTGDIFITRTSDKRIIFDQSMDCFVDGGKFLTEESVGQLFKKAGYLSSFNRAVKTMFIGVDSYEGQNLYWNLDGSPEGLEYKYFPDTSHNIDGSFKSEHRKNNQLIIAIGIQYDEIVMSPFYTKYMWLFRLCILLGMVVSVMFEYRATKYAGNKCRTTASTD